MREVLLFYRHYLWKVRLVWSCLNRIGDGYSLWCGGWLAGGTTLTTTCTALWILQRRSKLDGQRPRLTPPPSPAAAAAGLDWMLTIVTINLFSHQDEQDNLGHVMAVTRAHKTPLFSSVFSPSFSNHSLPFTLYLSLSWSLPVTLSTHFLLLCTHLNEYNCQHCVF